MNTSGEARVASVDDYIATFSDDVRSILNQVRRTMHKAAPDAVETISYGMPTLLLDGKHLVHFAGWKHHVSVYPVPAADEADDAFEREIAPYRSGKSTAKFPLARPVPYDLIETLVTHLATPHRRAAHQDNG